jgi:hypothetical protein
MNEPEFSGCCIGREFQRKGLLEPPEARHMSAAIMTKDHTHLKSCMLCNSGRPVDNMSENSV